MPKLKLVELLRRRKMSLRQLLDEFGITTYDGLLARCNRLGVMPPEELEFKQAMPQNILVNNPSEGVVVSDLVDFFPPEPEDVVTTGDSDNSAILPEPTEHSQKKLRKKKE